jgi:hypothetical protein
MVTRWIAPAVAAALALAGGGCSSASSAPHGHTLTLTGKLTPQSGQLAFMTPSISIVRVPIANVVGKPYLIASFKAGFSPGNDPAIDHVWGTVPADLTIKYTTPANYSDGAYDMVLVIYASTAITPEIMAKPAHQAPAAVKGDMATFTNDMTVVKPGDPTIPLGVVRLNVQGGDAEIVVENRTPADPSNSDQLKASINDTVMILP